MTALCHQGGAALWISVSQLGRLAIRLIAAGTSGMRSFDRLARDQATGRLSSIAATAPRHGHGHDALQRALRREAGLALLAMRGKSFLDVRARESEKLQCQRCIEDRPGRTQPVVERVFGPA